MRWTEILNERGEGYLYHITNPDEAARIIASNELKPMTSHHSERLGMMGSRLDAGKGYVTGVSLTRDINFSKTWLSGQGVIFVLDASLLRHNIKLRPVDYYAAKTRERSASANRFGQGSVRSEAEEFAIGGIKNVDRYIVEVRMHKSQYDECVYDNEDYENQQEDSRYWYLTNYPKLKLI